MACHALWLASLAFLHTCAVTFATTAPRLSEAQNMASAWSPPLVRTSSQRDRDTSQVHTRSRLHPIHARVLHAPAALCGCQAARPFSRSLHTHHIKATAGRSPSCVAVRQVVSTLLCTNCCLPPPTYRAPQLRSIHLLALLASPSSPFTCLVLDDRVDRGNACGRARELPIH
jgi:hypothetical protein